MIPQQEHAPAITQMPGSRAARRAVNARRPRGTRVEANAKSIDAPEHSGTLKGVMAAGIAESESASKIVASAWQGRGHDRDQIQRHDGGLIAVVKQAVV